MTNQTNPNRSTNTETTGENSDHSTHPGRPPEWEDSQPDQNKPDTTAISDPPNHGFDYYYRLINLDTCSYTYATKGSALRINWHGRIQNMDEFKDALYQLYRSTYNSDLTAANLRPKAFESFVDQTFSKQLKYAFQKREPIEGPPGPLSQAKQEKINERITVILQAAVIMACERRTQLGRKHHSKDNLLNSVLPDHVREQSA